MPLLVDHSDDATVGERTSLVANGSKYDDEDDEVEQSDDHPARSTRKSSMSSLKKDEEDLSLWSIACILSTSFAYGCIMTTLFLITLPVECQRIENQNPSVPKSIALGCFVAIAGVTQLISPLIGMLSDTYRPPLHFQLGQRLPYLALGSVCSVCGLLGEYIYSYQKLWLRYGGFFFWHMIGLNMTYAMMIALIPDQVPHTQTGIANGILAFELVTGSLTGFALFHFYFGGHVQDMYGLYICIVVITTLLTSVYAQEGDAARMELIYSRRHTIQEITRRHRRRQLILGPFALIKTMLWDPIRVLDQRTMLAAYTIDVESQHDFFIVTVSRLCYYCGSSVQTFFLYFLHDIIRVTDDTESAVATLAVVSQISGALFCYPMGFFSDRFCDGRRKPFVYTACVFLGAVTFSMVFARTMNQMTILCFILGAANGSYLTMETSLAVDTLPDDYEDGPSGGHAQLLGIWGVAAFLGSALGPMVGGPLLYLVGSRGPLPEGQDYSIYGYAVVLLLSTIYFLLSAISLRWVRKFGV